MMYRVATALALATGVVGLRISNDEIESGAANVDAIAHTTAALVELKDTPSYLTDLKLPKTLQDILEKQSTGSRERQSMLKELALKKNEDVLTHLQVTLTYPLQLYEHLTGPHKDKGWQWYQKVLDSKPNPEQRAAMILENEQQYEAMNGVFMNNSKIPIILRESYDKNRVTPGNPGRTWRSKFLKRLHKVNSAKDNTKEKQKAMGQLENFLINYRA